MESWLDAMMTRNLLRQARRYARLCAQFAASDRCWTAIEPLQRDILKLFAVTPTRLTVFIVPGKPFGLRPC